MKKSIPLAALLGTAPIVALLGAGSLIGVSNDAQAAPVAATLVSVTDHSYPVLGHNIFNLSLSTATWTFDEVTGEAAMTGGTYYGEILAPPLYAHTMSGVKLGNYVPTLGTWSCQEGAFGGMIAVSLCGNYNFGANKINQSTYTPSAQGATLTLGGDDGLYPGFLPLTPQSLQTSYSNMTTTSLGGGLYRLSNANFPGSTASTYGYDFVFQQNAVVPVPAAVWLFGSALAMMGVMRRRQSA